MCAANGGAGQGSGCWVACPPSLDRLEGARGDHASGMATQRERPPTVGQAEEGQGARCPPSLDVLAVQLGQAVHHLFLQLRRLVLAAIPAPRVGLR